ncbi:integrin alpha-E isoform X2 [Hyla sarda]|uniref:integrin alpha-E isoform X2 n=1 Tax=Hyla sarda TaxID=327740 RepID=UPI0024C42B8D|nr:integrin alpha-E isoform X2 [Hyla sarda]
MGKQMKDNVLVMVPSECFNIDIGKAWSYRGKEKSLFGQNVMQYKTNSEKGVYVFSPLKDPERRTFEGLYKCELKDVDLHLQCKMENIKLPSGQDPVNRVNPYPIVSFARNADSFMTCQQFKRQNKKTTTGELNGVCLLHINENGSLKERVYPNLTTTVFDFLEEKKKMKKDNSNNNNNNNTIDRPILNIAVTFTDKFLDSKKDNKHDSNSNNNNNIYDIDEEGGTEIAIVLDGSGSISKVDFQEAKDFIFNLITKIWEKCFECEFAVVQYGDIIQTEFDLWDSRKDSLLILDKVKKIQQVGNVTKTASALLHVLDSIFDESHGSRKNANKIILVLTDGDIFMDPVNITTVINDPRMKTIERFIIGVGGVFNKTNAYSELKLIATEEKDHVIRVEDYSKLDGLISSLQQKMAGIEGSKGDSLEFDLAEVGFSAHLKDKDTLVLGAVGAFDWSGGLMVYSMKSEQHKVSFLNESSEVSKAVGYSYLGYSVSTAKRKYLSLYIAGAPRYSNVGKVLVFEEDFKTHHLKQTLTGEQLGSYFGHQLCTVDINKDGYTDILLVGAPFYHIKGEEGRVYLYKLIDEREFTLVLKLEQPYYSFARFGYSIAQIGDVNNDGFQDVAIGAPLEGRFEDPNSFGSVYIYNSMADGIYKTPSQRIRATDIKQKLQFFGQAVDGGLDITGDGYIDIAIGALGNVVVLQSCPVVKIRATMQFVPNKIPVTPHYSTVNASLCFNVIPYNQTELNKSYLDYKMDLDVLTEQRRITINNEISSRRKLFFTHENCTSFLLTVLPCTYDCFKDIVIRISYTLVSDLRRDLPPPGLDFHDQNYTDIQLPYEKDCNNKTICIPKLLLTTQVSRSQLVVGNTTDVTVTLSLTNSGDNSYMTNVIISYPKILQFTLIKPPNKPGIECSPPKMIPSAYSSMTCGIQHPVFKASTETFSIIWQLTEERFSSPKATINYVVNNVNNVSDSLVQKTVLPVRHSFSAVLSVQQTALFVTIPSDPPMYEEVYYTFNVNAENPFAAELILELKVPIIFKRVPFSDVQFIQTFQNSTQCTNETQARSCGDTFNNEETKCLFIACKIPSGREEIKIATRLFLRKLQELVKEIQDFNVTGEILYDKTLYVNLKEPEHKTQLSIKILETKVIPILPVFIGSSVGGVVLLCLIIIILVKCGFFKRKYKNFDQDGTE